MGYFATYKRQVAAFYRQLWRGLFARERVIDGPLRDFVPKPGFFWEFLAMHKWFVISILRVPMILLQLVFGYFALLIICGLVLIAPLVIIVVFPIFVWQRRKRLKVEGSEL
ncbi:MAG: hypothetical protein DRQ89_12440 [Epsilonproteobacteria bacterium]|nr:MAG: hypothetical protein DRQ89_12440 [Campylobacterota bacterium]